MKVLGIISKKSKALVIGIGGGGDVLNAIPVSNFLRSQGLSTILGGLTWQWAWSGMDLHTGPRSIREYSNITPLSDTMGLVNPETKLPSGLYPPEAAVCKILKEDVILLDPTRGVKGIIRDFEILAKTMNIDLFVGVDGGGDSLLSPEDTQVRSPLADTIMLSALAKTKFTSILAVTGLGSDLELGINGTLKKIALVMQLGGYLGAWGVTYEDASALNQVLEKAQIKTHTPRVLLECIRGKYGEKYVVPPLAHEPRKLEYSPIVALIWFLDPRTVCMAVNRIAAEMYETSSLEEAWRIFRDHGFITEIELEKEFLKQIER